MKKFILSHQGVEVFKGTENECYFKLQRSQSQSADWAIKYEGWKVEEEKPEILNFTQFCIKNGFPCDNDTMFAAQLLGGRGLDGNISKRNVKAQDQKFAEMQQENKKAHELFYESVKNWLLIDGSGKLTKENILKSESLKNTMEIESKINQAQKYIDFVKSMKTSYLKNGKLKKSFQLAVNDHEEKIQILKNQL